MALFGIKRIQYCKATQLAFSGQNNPFLGIASEPTNTFTDVVCMINSRATLTIEQAVVNKQIVYTAKLQFVTPADPMLDVDHYAFIATTNEGERILLGANTRPQVAVVTAQGVFGNAGELTAYTTTAEFKADYRPLRLPVTAAEPISGPAYDICCGQIKTAEPISGPAYDVCCGEIVGSPTMLTVIWQNYDGTEVDRQTYPEGAPEPTTTVVPTKPSTMIYQYVFDGWSLYSQTSTTKIYRAQYNEETISGWAYVDLIAQGEIAEQGRARIDYVDVNSTQQETGDVGNIGYPVGHFGVAYNGSVPNWYKAFAFAQSEAYTVLSADWKDFFEAFTDFSPIYDANNPDLIIGYKKNNYSGPLPPWS